MYSFSDFRDCVMSACTSNNKLFLVGSDESKGIGRRRYRVVSLSTNSGDLINEWVDERYSRYAMLTSCISVKDKLYVSGITNRSWSIILFDEDLDIISRREFVDPYLISSSVVAIDESEDSLFIIGTELSPDMLTSAYVARLSPRNLETLDKKLIRISNASIGCYSAVYDDSMKKIILGCYIKTIKGPKWLLIVLGKNLDLLTITALEIDGLVIDGAIDREGYVYMVDGNQLVKFNNRGQVQAKIQIPLASRVKYIHSLNVSAFSKIAVIADKEIIVLSGSDMRELDRTQFIEDKTLYLPYPSAIATRNDELYIASTVAKTHREYDWIVTKLTLE